jgi:undecaprenyl diphosphate synthase
MDGNGRWAAAHGRPRLSGHEKGADSVRAVTEECARIGGIAQLTLYALSYDNLHKRPKSEVSGLFRLLARYLRKEFKTLMKNNLRFTTIGEIEELPEDLQHDIRESVLKSAGNTGMVLCFALNYSSRREITHAARELARRTASGELSPGDITERGLQERLFTGDAPDVDLLIRTGGEMRVSDFLLWQISYAEIYVTDVYWPDFRAPQLHEALDWFAGRQRRFGALGEQ